MRVHLCVCLSSSTMVLPPEGMPFSLYLFCFNPFSRTDPRFVSLDYLENGCLRNRSLAKPTPVGNLPPYIHHHHPCEVSPTHIPTRFRSGFGHPVRQFFSQARSGHTGRFRTATTAQFVPRRWLQNTRSFPIPARASSVHWPSNHCCRASYALTAQHGQPRTRRDACEIDAFVLRRDR